MKEDSRWPPLASFVLSKLKKHLALTSDFVWGRFITNFSFLLAIFLKWRKIQNGRQNKNCRKLSKLGIKLIVLTRQKAWWCSFGDYSKTKMAAGDRNFANVGFFPSISLYLCVKFDLKLCPNHKLKRLESYVKNVF